MTIAKFLKALERRIGHDSFKALCALARDGKMGFGAKYNDWGTADLKAG